MKKRLICTSSLVVVAGLASVIFVVFVAPSSAQPSVAGEVTPMQTITPTQLAAMHLFLGAPPAGGAAVNAAQADQALEARGVPGEAILETTLATCSMTAQPASVPLPYANRPCWVISVKPEPMTISAPPGWTGQTKVAPTVQYALVDANTGKIFDEAAGIP